MPDKPKILIADDEPAITESYASVLTRDNFEVEKAFDGEECLSKAAAADFDLILLDVHMPKMDGYEVSKRLKQLPHLKNTRVVFLSGFSTSPDSIEAGYLSGGIEFWKKPMATDEFEVRVRSILRIAEAEKKLREMQEVFVSMIVHDLRGPLGGIVGFAEMLSEERERLGPEVSELVDEIGKAARLMLNVVVDYLEITRLEAGESRLSRMKVNLREIVDNSLEALGRVRKEKPVNVNVVCDDLPALFVDPERIGKVFIQLLDNAFRFTPAGGTVSVIGTVSANSVVVRVQDTGPGIRQQDLPNLFDKMRITTPGAKRLGSKTGLGLPICKGIVEAHGGTIVARSDEGKGTTITLTLPIQLATAQA
ncbi:MAG TPA: hybrid sensor histidine kinase/response regulator [Bacteroidota bacterium]|nr:hybrid sensor histidine kinase/response regulator [Bacteroidota bacterium]